MSSAGLVRDLPDHPIPLEEVIRRWPAIRQSDLAWFNNCELGSYFNMKFANGYSTTPQARGTIEHRVIAAAIREMQRTDNEGVSPEVAKAIMWEKLRQHGIPREERVRVPIAEIPVIEAAVGKWAWDTRLSIRDVLDTERRLYGTLSYRAESGERIDRTISGQLDVMMQEGQDELLVLDYKGSLSAPVQRDQDENEDGKGLSPEGFLQQRVYSILGLQNFASLKAVVTREVYHRITKMRPARMTRAQLPRAEELVALVVEDFDAALASGPPRKLTLDALEDHGFWRPSPGPSHCRMCPGRRFCPVSDEVTVGGITSPKMAKRLADTRTVIRETDKAIKPHLESWVHKHGPIPLKAAKEKRVLGFRPIANGKTRFEDWAPSSEDYRPPEQPSPDLVDAMKQSVQEAREQRTEPDPVVTVEQADAEGIVIKVVGNLADD